MLDKLKGLNGKDFTKQYNSDQVSGHKDAVSLFERYDKGGDNPELKDWANKTLPTLRDPSKWRKTSTSDATAHRLIGKCTGAGAAP